MSEADDVLRAIDQLRRDLSGYHGQMVAHNDLQRHCDNQRQRIAELEGLYARAKAERDETAMAFSKEHDRAEFLMREKAKLRERVAELEELLPENGRWFGAEVVEAYATECRALKTLAADMYQEHERIYHASGLLLPIGATDEQMESWRSECERWGIEVGE